ncbi:MAG: ATP-binding protein, partial [Cyclobacteriaceae bacterium]|nr:ATP-binding protein [Cyclobacteriaceae bacterium]
MDFNNLKKSISLRVLALVLTIFLFINSFYKSGFSLTILVFALLIAIQVFFLIKFIEKEKSGVEDFIRSVEADDFDSKTQSGAINKGNIESRLLSAVQKMGRKREYEEDDFHYMKNIIQHIGMGIITFNNRGKVQIVNTATKRLLKVNYIKNIDELGEVSPQLVEIFNRLKTGGRELLRLEIGGDIIQLAIYAIQLTLKGEEFKLISLQNIQNELEEKEMEAWQNLVRVLTHEIMNSITPITSLAATIEDDLHTFNSNGEEIIKIGKDELDDVQMAIKIIKTRGEGLVRFVQDFRNLTHIPQPKIAEIKVEELFGEVTTLMGSDFKTNSIDFIVDIFPKNMTLNADKELITQVLINLLKNAVQAFEEEMEDKSVELKAFFGEKGRPILVVKDNGVGIEEEALEKIFIPF